MEELKRDLADLKAPLASLERHSARHAAIATAMRKDFEGLLRSFSRIERQLVTLCEWKASLEARLNALERKNL